MKVNHPIACYNEKCDCHIPPRKLDDPHGGYCVRDEIVIDIDGFCNFEAPELRDKEPNFERQN